MSNGPVLVGPCHLYIPKAFRLKGYPSFLCHIVEAMFMQMLGLACRQIHQLEFAVFSEIAVPHGDDVCICGKCGSLVG